MSGARKNSVFMPDGECCDDHSAVRLPSIYPLHTYYFHMNKKARECVYCSKRVQGVGVASAIYTSCVHAKDSDLDKARYSEEKIPCMYHHFCDVECMKNYEKSRDADETTLPEVTDGRVICVWWMNGVVDGYKYI